MSGISFSRQKLVHTNTCKGFAARVNKPFQRGLLEWVRGEPKCVQNALSLDLSAVKKRLYSTEYWFLHPQVGEHGCEPLPATLSYHRSLQQGTVWQFTGTDYAYLVILSLYFIMNTTHCHLFMWHKPGKQQQRDCLDWTHIENFTLPLEVYKLANDAEFSSRNPHRFETTEEWGEGLVLRGAVQTQLDKVLCGRLNPTRPCRVLLIFIFGNLTIVAHPSSKEAVLLLLYSSVYLVFLLSSFTKTMAHV